MSDIHFTKQHDLGLIKVRELVGQWQQKIEQKLSLKAEYSQGEVSDTLTLKRSGINARIEITDTQLEAFVELGMMMKPMKSMIENEIEKGFAKMLEKIS